MDETLTKTVDETAPTANRALSPLKWLKSGKIYEAGTLRYTPRSLMIVSVWLLCGDFFFHFFGTAMPQVLPLCLKDLRASNSLIGFMMSGIPGVISILIGPSVSLWTDRYRSRLGRRIPFLLWATPGTAICLILLGYAGPIGAWLHRILGSWAGGVSVAGLSLIVMCVLVAMFHFFNVFVCGIYYALLKDVLPIEMMSRFISIFRVIGGLGGFLFSAYIFKYADQYRTEMFLWVGLIYLAAFMLMCWRVKEGVYPPLAADSERHGLVSLVRTYCQDCFTIPIFLFFFVLCFLIGLTDCLVPGPFQILFLRDTVGLSLDKIGNVNGWGALVTAIAFIPAGLVSEKIHPVRAFTVALGASMILAVVSYFLIQDYATALIFMVIKAPFLALGLVGQLALMMHLFPKEKFAQYFCVVGIVGCGSMVFGSYVMGKIVDLFGDNYRVVLLWSALFMLLSFIPLRLVYREWKRHGGENYIPPTLESLK